MQFGFSILGDSLKPQSTAKVISKAVNLSTRWVPHLNLVTRQCPPQTAIKILGVWGEGPLNAPKNKTSTEIRFKLIPKSVISVKLILDSY